MTHSSASVGRGVRVGVLGFGMAGSGVGLETLLRPSSAATATPGADGPFCCGTAAWSLLTGLALVGLWTPSSEDEPTTRQI